MNLVDRVKRLLLQPKEEWQVIDQESVDVVDLYKSYIAPLAAIGPLCSAIGMSMVGTSLAGVGTFRVSFGSALVQSVVLFGLMLGGVYVIALIIDALAPTFGAQRSKSQALKLAAYASTASWLGGVFTLIPMLGVLGLLAALYSLYLFYLGLPILMRVPEGRTIGYTAVVVLSTVVLFIVINAVIPMPTPILPASGTIGR
jgi:hypothetical protein